MKRIIAFGNPLLDVTVASKDDAIKLIEKYNLNPDGQKEITHEEMRALTRDIEGLEKHVSAGGCCQNSLRVMQWLSGRKCDVSIFGAVGRDREAEILKTTLQSEGVNARYIEQDTLPTGKTVALVNGLKRSLVAHIGAAEIFPLKSLLSHPNFSALFENADIIFIEAFFLTNRFDTAKHIIELCEKHDKLRVFNLCGDYVFKVVPDAIRYMVYHSDVIFGNAAEYKALKDLLNFATLEELVADLFAKTLPANRRKKIVVITDGPRPVICYFDGGKTSRSPQQISKGDIKDTTAAGDAFVGGFLSGLAASKDLNDCIRLGLYTASNIIKQIGCTTPSFQPEIST